MFGKQFKIHQICQKNIGLLLWILKQKVLTFQAPETFKGEKKCFVGFKVGKQSFKVKKHDSPDGTFFLRIHV